ncbi:unnamed protein product [Ambrosiozyma monospora]|uniref:Unnamed protein product n=1 Tax=Ambrosiozyma monospora TaxID=43982 RepID=A0ACB5TV16_AMBMO|nr:unnamed protein product [Ambrosiozyma monospora]
MKKRLNVSNGVGEPVTVPTDQLLSHGLGREPITVPTDQLLKKSGVVKDAKIPSVADTVTQDTTTTTQKVEPPEGFNKLNFQKYLSFINSGDVCQDYKQPNNVKLEDIVHENLPISIISKFTDPKLNLSIEKYIYDNMPDPRTNELARRMVLYKNKPVIVMGKNQNPFKEINLRLAGLYEIPIIRRMSGGGTVVHDLGNVNFSFIASKEEFHRAKFSGLLVDKLNELIGVDGFAVSSNGKVEYNMPTFKLGINAKGDIINAENEKKVSGSAYQISKGKSLHHGTMLLNVNLKVLGKLLKLSPRRKESIICKSIDSIPSPVQNMGVDEEIFKYCCVNAFIEGYGHQVGTLHEDYDNLIKLNGSDVVKVDSYQELPEEVWENYKRFGDWNWTFGKTPKFQFKLYDEENGYFDVTFVIDRGLVIKEVIVDEDINGYFSRLVETVEQGSEPVVFVGEAVKKYINDEEIAKVVSWNIDFNVNYQRMYDGVKL